MANENREMSDGAPMTRAQFIDEARKLQEFLCERLPDESRTEREVIAEWLDSYTAEVVQRCAKFVRTVPLDHPERDRDTVADAIIRNLSPHEPCGDVTCDQLTCQREIYKRNNP